MRNLHNHKHSLALSDKHLLFLPIISGKHLLHFNTCKIITLEAIALASARIDNHLKSISYSIRFLLQSIIFNNFSIQRLTTKSAILQTIARLSPAFRKIYFQNKSDFAFLACGFSALNCSAVNKSA